MKSLYVILTASLFLAALPLAGATHSTCSHHPAQEGIAHPLTPGRYLYLTPTQPDKLGEWLETNRVGGLQTDACFGSTGIRWYSPDAKALVLP